MTMTTIRIDCPFCGREHSVDVEWKAWEAYCNGAFAQTAFPTLSATEREQIISGLCPTCQQAVFGKGEE